ncbi:transposase, partial [Geobacillus stearothermophilus]|nr:transposase [Geobacillus stearothermophilus]
MRFNRGGKKCDPVHDFGIDIQTYTDRGKGNDFPDVNQCPHCPSRRPLHRHGYYQRYALTAEGEYRLWIARYAR